MGLITSRFYDKPSTKDKLERIEQELQNIEERRWDKKKREQFIVQILSFIPIIILIATFCYLIYPSDSTYRVKFLNCIPIVILLTFLWACKNVVEWYSRWSLDNEEVRLRKLQKEKKKILEMVCETESYRVAAELLEKYDPKQLRRRERPSQPERPISPLNTTLTKISASPNIRNQPKQQQQANQLQQQQQVAQVSFLNQSLSYPVRPTRQVPAPPPPTPMTKPDPKASQTLNTSIMNTSLASPIVAASSVQGRPVRPILTKDRSLFERMVDWVLADGPDNRFALICRYCYGHNGMSLAEEYETINFRCCYCYNLNTSTNKRHQVHDRLQSEREKGEQQQTTTKDATDKTVNTKEQDNLLEEESEMEGAVAKQDELKEEAEDQAKGQETDKDDENETESEPKITDRSKKVKAVAAADEQKEND